MSAALNAGTAGAPRLSVVICCHNGAAGLRRALDSLAGQTVVDELDVIVVDDGSSDDTAAVARASGARVLLHEVNRGVAAARNTGLRAARSDLVAFTDDDCLAEPTWAAELLAAADRRPEAFAWGGPATAAPAAGWVSGYLRHVDPLAPLERSLLNDDGFWHRLRAYLRRAGSRPPAGERDVASVAGANMLVRRDAALAHGGFDERFRFGGEEEELFRRAVRAGQAVVFVPSAQVRHRYVGTLGDTLRRSRAYGRGNARMRLKHPEILPTLYPAPVLVAGLLALSVAHPAFLLAAALLPQALFVRWGRAALADADPVALSYPYLQLLQESASNVGWVGFHLSERDAFRRVGS